VEADISPTTLGPAQRDAALAALTGSELQVLVVGGGITGAGAALDAVSRGLSTGLVEAGDFGSDGSGRSSTLVHGGPRYPEQRSAAGARAALGERSLLLERLAPHLVRAVPFLVPFTHRVWERAYVGAGPGADDLLRLSTGRARGLPGHRQLSRHAAGRLAPGLRRSAFTGALRYWDAQADDARYVTTLVRTAAGYGALVASRTQVTGFLREGERVTGVRAVDLESGRELEIRAQQVVTAAGRWSGGRTELAGGRTELAGGRTAAGAPAALGARSARDVHLVVPRDRIHAAAGLIVRTPAGALAAVPCGRHWIIGAAGPGWSRSPGRPIGIDDILAQLNAVLAVPLTRDDVTGASGAAAGRLPRQHAVGHPVPGLVTVAGGDLASYRRLAADAVDAAARDLPGRVAPSCTDVVALAGADGYAARWNARRALAGSSGLHVARIEHLLRRYGSLAGQVLELIAAEPGLAEPLAGADDYLRAEIVYAVTHEGARHLDDMLERRTHVGTETRDGGLSAAPEAVGLMAGPLRWTAAQARRELAGYQARVAAERAAREAGARRDATEPEGAETRRPVPAGRD
jgi:glycerol-3-phosphate dehydrogenase